MTFFAYGIIKSWHDLNAFELIRHPWFVSAFLAGGLAQLIKMATIYFRTKKLDARQLSAAGGMPSAHTSLVTALTAAVGLTDGFNSPEAMITAGLATITMVDAISIRHEAGKHAKLLNQIVARLNERERFEAEHLRERLGHRRREVVAGFFFGTIIAILVCGFWDFWK